jgi:uncharacterized protein (TIGR02118 family)
MIIRSGLIRNRDGVDFGTFRTHWRNVHAPLVVKIRGLRAYSQNHIRERLSSNPASGLHRVDGISQLYFDDVEAMKVAMASPEQAACIVDLRDFLSDVTLLIQRAGDVETFGPSRPLPIKLLYLLNCVPDAPNELAQRIISAMSAGNRGGKYRVNPVIERDVTVDRSISAGNQVVDFVVEIWAEDSSSAHVVSSLCETSEDVDIIGGFIVEELTVLPKPGLSEVSAGAPQ